jgi:dethiobiotin synthetase/adenosylmethionine--8-amino-7-oxononanoate aminotransferase
LSPLQTPACARPRSSPLAKQYQQHIEAALDAHEAGGSARLAALLMEPVLQGAGGMLLVDPLFQAVAVQVGRSLSQSGVLG